jgi:hypothetical protein
MRSVTRHRSERNEQGWSGRKRSLPQVIAWCGFVGAWLLILGPLNQAIRELQEEDFERDALARAESEIEVPPPISPWWLIAPPVYYVLRRRRDHVYKQRVLDAMSPDDVRALAHLRDVASAWFLVAAGASLIAAKETWELVETYEWGEWSFWVLLAGMLTLGAVVALARIRPSNPY